GRRVETLFPQSAAFWVPRARRGPLTIVGVAGDVREDGLRDAAGLPQLYLPYAQNPTIVATLVARTRGGPAEAAAPAIREAARGGAAVAVRGVDRCGGDSGRSRRALRIRLVSLTRINESAFDEALQPVECLVPLRRDRLQLPARVREPLLFQLPDALAPLLLAAHEAGVFHHAQVLGDRLTRD